MMYSHPLLFLPTFVSSTVFIGVGLDQEAIESALDECLLSDEEMETYRANLEKLIETVAVQQAQ